jgi:hypothetical protein
MIQDRRISELNKMNLTSTHGHTIFSDWTDEEYERLLTPARPRPVPKEYSMTAIYPQAK